MVYGSRGQIAWFYGIVYEWVRNTCKNIYIKIIVHSIGIILMVFGLFYFITYFMAPGSAYGMIMMFAGLIIFLTPLGVDSSG